LIFPLVESRHQWVEKNQMVLTGHRSIVNQVRYNPQRCLLASSGVEKVIKLWNPFEMENWSGSLLESINDNVREVFSHEEYISLNMTHDYSNQNTNEDPRMIAFFDYLVQQEIEGWSSSESSDQTSDHSSENSSRADSPTSDTEPTTTFTAVKTVHRNRGKRK
jgi:WD repeat-containing protein 22